MSGCDSGDDMVCVIVRMYIVCDIGVCTWGVRVGVTEGCT